MSVCLNKKNSRKSKRRIYKGGASQEPVKNTSSFDSTARGVEAIQNMVNNVNETGLNYGFYFDEINHKFGDFALGIIWDQNRLGEFHSGQITSFINNDTARPMMFLITQKQVEGEQTSYTLIINFHGPNNRLESLFGCPTTIKDINQRFNEFLIDVGSYSTASFDKIKKDITTNFIITCDSNDKYGSLSKNPDESVTTASNFAKNTSTDKFQLLTGDKSVHLEIKKPTVVQKSCCHNWDSCGVLPTSKYTFGVLDNILEKYDYPLNLFKGHEELSEAFKEIKKIPLDEAEHLFDRDGKKKANAGAGKREKIPPTDSKISNYLFRGDYVFSSQGSDVTIFTVGDGPLNRVSDKSDHELVMANTPQGVVGSYNMSFASDLGIVVNHPDIVEKGRQDSEAGFLLNLDHCNPNVKSNGDQRRLYWENAKDHLKSFLQSSFEYNGTSATKPVAIGLQELNSWKHISAENPPQEAPIQQANPAPKIALRTVLPVLENAKDFDRMGLKGKGFISKEVWESYIPKSGSSGGKNKKKRSFKRHRAKKSKSLKK